MGCANYHQKKSLSSNNKFQQPYSNSIFKSFIQKVINNPEQKNDIIDVQNSSILKNLTKLQTLIKMFQPQQLKQIKLIFKASQHDFSIKKYYQKCGNQYNTVIVCLTNHDKIIGGYTPLKFNILTEDNSYAADKSYSSFVFSLSTNQVFTLQNHKKAIYRSFQQQSINFGAGMFWISNKANVTFKSGSHLGNTNYTNQKYKHSKQFYLQHTGWQGANFFIKEWEVFAVKIQSKQNYFQQSKYTTINFND